MAKFFAGIRVVFGDEEEVFPADQKCFSETKGNVNNLLAYRNPHARDPDNCTIFLRGKSGNCYHLRTDGTAILMSPNIFQKEIDMRKENCREGKILEIFEC